MATKTCGIILVHYQGLPLTLACLDSLAKTTHPRAFQVYITAIDTKENVDRLARHPLQPTIIPSQNLGFSGNNNLAIRRALADGVKAVVLLNNDTEAAPGFLDPLLKSLNRPNTGMVSPLIYFSPGCEFHHDAYTPKERGKVVWYAGGVIDWHNVYPFHWGVNEVDHGQFKAAAETDFATGCCLGITRATIERIGLLDERYFLYYEDTDWSMRAKQAGLKIWFEPAAKVWHKNAGSTGGSGSATQVYYQTRNRILFGLTYAPLRTKAALLKESIGKWRRGPEAEKAGVADAWLRHFGKRGFQ